MHSQRRQIDKKAVVVTFIDVYYFYQMGVALFARGKS